MARKWSGFLPQNLLIKEEWELLEACESRARKAEEAKLAQNESPRRRTGLRGLGDLQSE
jgi:hypothetical protein